MVGKRQTRRFERTSEIEPGRFFIVEGLIAYVAEAGEPFINESGNRDSRLRVIFDNGTESNLLARSLQKALMQDPAGRRITEPDAGPLFDQEVEVEGSAAMDMMLELIAARDGRDTAVDVSEQFLHGPARPANGMQRQDVRWRYRVTDRRIETTIRVMEDHLTSPLRIARIAELAGLSERQLERLFGEAFGQCPSQFYLELRLKEARSKLLGSSDTLEEIAEAMGFSSQAHFSRAVKAWCGASPLAIRKRRASGHVGLLQGNGASK